MPMNTTTDKGDDCPKCGKPSGLTACLDTLCDEPVPCISCGALIEVDHETNYEDDLWFWLVEVRPQTPPVRAAPLRPGMVTFQGFRYRDMNVSRFMESALQPKHIPLDMSSSYHRCETITQPLYDSCDFPKKRSDEPLRFFQQCIGMGVGQDGGPKTERDTNMHIGGQLPPGQGFEIARIQLGIITHDKATMQTRSKAQRALDSLCTAGHMRLAIGSKLYLEVAPLGQLVEGHKGFFLDFDFASKKSHYIIDHEVQTGPLDLGKCKLRLDEQRYFAVEINRVPPLDVDARLSVHLHGTMYRRLA
jgi:hypothetical protein